MYNSNIATYVPGDHTYVELLGELELVKDTQQNEGYAGFCESSYCRTAVAAVYLRASYLSLKKTQQHTCLNIYTDGRIPIHSR